MRAPNEKCKEKNEDGIVRTVWPKDYKDIFGYDIKIGAYVIFRGCIINLFFIHI